MGLYDKKVFLKNEKGKWIEISREIENAPHDVGRWRRSLDLEKKSNAKERTFLNYQPTRTGLNQKVTSAVTYFDNSNEKVVRKLITTSRKLSLKDSQKYLGYKYRNLFLK